MLSNYLKRAQCHRTLPRAFMSTGTDTAFDKKDKLVVFDTTLRDGEQSPGATLTFREKLQIAKQLSLLGVDVCEAGFPISSPGDFDAVSAIAEQIGPLTDRRSSGKPMRIAGLARAHEKDITRAYNAVKHAPLHRIHTFLATSDIHLEYKLKISREECIRKAVAAVQCARSLMTEEGGDVEFSPEDAGRSDPAFLAEVLGEVIKAGATTLNIPDTVGYTVPEEYGGLFNYLIAHTPGADGVVWSTHCHNDLGLATANTLAAVQNGARQVEVTINGIGERAGNTSLEEVAMALATRPQRYPVVTELDTTQIMRCSRMVSSFTGMSVQPNKAIVGANAFAHEAGIHQDGMLKNASTYEIMLPESVGLSPQSQLVLGKHSGRHAYGKRLEALGYSLSESQLDEMVEKFKRLADEKKTVTDADLEAIVDDKLFRPDPIWTLCGMHVTGGNLVKSTATITLKDKDGQEVSEAAMGTGPVDATFRALRNATGIPTKLTEFTVNSVTGSTRALGYVTVRVKPPSGPGSETDDDEGELNPQTGVMKTRSYVGHGTATDIIVAAAQAYLSAVNRMHSAQLRNARTAERTAAATAATEGEEAASAGFKMAGGGE